MRRFGLSFIALLLTACTSPSPDEGTVMITTAENGRHIDGADCSVTNNVQRWEVVTPTSLMIGAPDGELHIICNKAGYRSSELRIPLAGTPSGPSINLGFGGASGGIGSAIGTGLGLTLPFDNANRGHYPSTITVNMTQM